MYISSQHDTVFEKSTLCHKPGNPTCASVFLECCHGVALAEHFLHIATVARGGGAVPIWQLRTLCLGAAGRLQGAGQGWPSWGSGQGAGSGKPRLGLGIPHSRQSTGLLLLPETQRCNKTFSEFMCLETLLSHRVAPSRLTLEGHPDDPLTSVHSVLRKGLQCPRLKTTNVRAVMLARRSRGSQGQAQGKEGLSVHAKFQRSG